ncbi:10191_t:CDS:1 [Cetraspora pellucida]|uniref:10191_t:CDS:1 n=1 Tax=Cetraspora pellucida TaxID=1433469 RepID=A0ACA9MI64_9GLOM|nr:10191_t:CDS:1 [Cetraspora pellucida]
MTATSRIKGAHATLKLYIQTFTGDLHQVYLTILLVITNQKKEIDAMIALEYIYIPTFALNNILYVNIRGKISTFALKKINGQYQKAKHATTLKLLPLCTRYFLRTLGLFCAHVIQQLEDSQSLILNNIHKHWWISGYLPVPQIEDNIFCSEDSLQPFLQDLQQRYQEWPKFQQSAACETLKDMIETSLITLQNSNIVHTKKHPSGASNYQTNLTRRDLSGFELVYYKVRHCTLC